MYFDNVNMAINSAVGTGATFFWSGNANPTATRDSAIGLASAGYLTLSDGTTIFWGTSSSSFGAGTTSTITLSFSCTQIYVVTANIAGNAASSTAGGTSGYTTSGSNPATQQFNLYAPVTGYYNWWGVCQR